MKPDNKAGGPWLYALGLVPVIWFALLIAPAISGGLSEIVSALPTAMNNPFKIVWCGRVAKHPNKKRRGKELQKGIQTSSFRLR